MTTRSDLTDVNDLLKRIRMDLTNAQSKLTDVTKLLNEEDKPKPKCVWCSATFRNQRMLEEHTYHTHGGPVPSHYLAAEHAAGIYDRDPGDEAA